VDWIFDNFQILAIVGLAFASWLKHRSDAKAAEREEKQAREETGELPDWFENEEEWKSPQQPEPPPLPPPLLRRAESAGAPPLVSKAPPPLPGMAEAANVELQRQEQIQQRLRELRESREASARQAKQAKDARQARQAKQARAARMPGESVPSPSGRLRALLHDRSQTRQAILMREILGPPVGLRRGSP
jgi:type IV secretory pathway VirB10-like protein